MIDAVTDLMAEAARTLVLPRFRSLQDGEAFEKAHGQLVTIADQESERFLTPRLQALLDVPVIGEEAVAEHPALIDATAGGDYWTVDPVDGTVNFAAGDEHFAIMVGLVRHGEPVLGWILHPVRGDLYVAERGAGAQLNGAPLSAPGPPAEPPRGVFELRFRSDERVARRRLITERYDIIRGLSAAGWEYPRLARGELDVCHFNGTWPWDHVPGTLIISELGGVTLRATGRPYQPAERTRHMVAAASAPLARGALDVLFGPLDDH